MPWFRIHGRDIYEFICEPRFHLLVFSSEKAPSVSNAMNDRWEGRVDSHFFAISNEVREIFGRDESFYLILRPDNYIGLISDDFSPEAVDAYLAKFD